VIPTITCRRALSCCVPPKRVRAPSPHRRACPPDHEAFASFTGAATALLTNPIWVVKVRMFTTTPETPNSYRGLWRKGPSSCFHHTRLLIRLNRTIDGLWQIGRTEGLPGLYRGTWLALFGVSNGAIQFMSYEKMKQWAFKRKRRQYLKAGKEWTNEADRLVRSFYRSRHADAH
jgi:solute carrier family 25 folate transporter 32